MENDVDITSSPQGVSRDIESYKFVNGKWRQALLSVPTEMAFTIFINSQELVTILCTPVKLNCLVIGYLFSEGIIGSLKDIASMRVCEDDSLADVKLNKTDFVLPPRRVLTSGCGGGVSFNSHIREEKIVSDIKIEPEKILQLNQEMLKSAVLYNQSGGIHTSAISDANTILVIGEDIGRHNTLDKILGECLLRKIPTKDKIILTSGRVSSEMLHKTARMQIPLIVSLTSPTEQAVNLARNIDITLVGYARGNHLTAYSKPERLGLTSN